MAVFRGFRGYFGANWCSAVIYKIRVGQIKRKSLLPPTEAEEGTNGSNRDHRYLFYGAIVVISGADVAVGGKCSCGKSVLERVTRTTFQFFKVELGAFA